MRLKAKVVVMEMSISFENITGASTSTHILVHIEPTKAFVIKIDIFDNALGSFLPQLKYNGQLHSFVFHL